MILIITGAAGAGKSTIIPILKSALDSQWEIIDWDNFRIPYDFTAKWVELNTQKIFKIIAKNLQQKLNTIIIGLLHPSTINKITRNFPKSEYCMVLLHLSADERKRRLEMRNASIELINDEEELKNFPLWFDELQYSNIIINTTKLLPKQIVDQIFRYLYRDLGD